MIPALFLLLAVAQVDSEEAKRKAGELVTQGNELFEAQSYQEALESFQLAYETFPSPKIHYNLARTLAACARPLEAIEHYEKFLGDADLSPSDSRAVKAREELGRLERQVGRISFVTAIAGSTLRLNDEPPVPLGESAIRVLPRPHRVRIDTPDGRRFEETVSVGAGETVRVHVIFPSATTPPAPAVAVTPALGETDPPITSKWWFWTAIGASAVAIGAGVAIGLSTRSGPFVRDGELDVTSTVDWERR